ncbi:TonB-dependent receptor plug domain-containing protein [Amphritea balenae]|nr:TonB-dependent receptor [Amphritea balenae]
MRSISLTLCTALLLLQSYKAAAVNDLALLNLSLMDLGDVRIYTASRYLTDIDKAAANITVVTSEDIQDKGYKSLYDVLRNTPGFFFFSFGGEIKVGLHGLPQVTDGYALVIDNNLIANNLANYHAFPNLAYVKQIEIIKGPSAVLWGDSASLGIVHIITKGADDLGDDDYNLVASADYEALQQRDIENVMMSKHYDQGSVFASLTSFDSDASWGEGFNTSESGPVPHELSNDMGDFDFDRSYDLYLKGSYNDFSVNLRSAKNYYKQGEEIARNTQYRNDDLFALNYDHDFTSAITTNLRTFYTRHNDYHDFYSLFGDNQNTSDYQVITKGAEAITTLSSDANTLLVGLYGHQQQIKNTSNGADGLNLSSNIYSQSVFLENSYTGLEDFVFSVGGRYTEKRDEQGTRYYNLPKFSVSYELTDKLTAKYLYSESEFFPFLKVTDGPDYLQSAINEMIMFDLQDEREVRSKNLQFSYSTQNTQAKLNFFYIRGQNFLNATWYENRAFTDFPLGDQDNIYYTQIDDFPSEIISKGVEFDLQHQYSWGELYSSINYTRSESKERPMLFGAVPIDIDYYEFIEPNDWNTTQMLSLNSLIDDEESFFNYPELTLNLGATFKLANNYKLNVNYRGLFNVTYKHSYTPTDFFFVTAQVTPKPVGTLFYKTEYGKQVTYKKLDPMHFIDLNLQMPDYMNSGVDVSVYVKNLFNSAEYLGETLEGAYVKGTYPQQFGLTAQYKF